MKRALGLIFCLISLVYALPSQGQFYYGLKQSFGQNRVQYQDFFWSFYGFERFDTYFYKDGRWIAQQVSRWVEEDLNDLEDRLDFRLDKKLQVLVYNNQNDFKQSNLNLPLDEESYNIGGLSKLVGTKVPIYFEGDHKKLRAQVRAGICQALINEMLFGGNIREVITSNTLIVVPEWFERGLVAYLSDPHRRKHLYHIQDGMRNERYEKFNRLRGLDAEYAGYGIWKYIVDRYGEKVIGQILYITRLNRNVESGFSLVLGRDLKNLWADWLNAWEEQLSGAPSDAEVEPQYRLKKHRERMVDFIPHPNGKDWAFVNNDLGKYRLYYQQGEEAPQQIWSKGHAVDTDPDLTYPHLDWHPNGSILAMITETEGRVVLMFYDLAKKTWIEKNLFQFEKVMGFCYSLDGRSFYIAGVRQGQSDIYKYSILANSIEPLTQDIYDDFDPSPLGNGRILFSSNRPNAEAHLAHPDSLPDPQRWSDLFVLEADEGQWGMQQLTQTPEVHESQAAGLEDLNFSYLAQTTRQSLVAWMRLDSAITYVDTITHYGYYYQEKGRWLSPLPVERYRPYRSVDQGILVQRLNDGKDEVLYRLVDGSGAEGAAMGGEESRTIRKELDAFVRPEEDLDRRQFEVNIEDYRFHPKALEQFGHTAKVEVKLPGPVSTDSVLEEPEFTIPAQANARLYLGLEYFVNQIDNSFLNLSYQPFTGGGALSLMPPMNGLFKVGLSDLFENYKLVGAFRLSSDLRNNEYLIRLQDLKRRYDKEYTFSRRSQLGSDPFGGVIKIITHQLGYQLAYPFNAVASLKGSLGYRHDRADALALNQAYAELEGFSESNVMFKAEYVQDATLPLGLNLYEGLRFKLFGEFYQDLKEGKERMYVLGADFRHYQVLHRNLIWANRFAASSSFGPEKLVYFMGGVDNWFGPKYNPATPIATDANYAYQTLATNMRGFEQNIRNGNNFMLINSELRFPVFNYLFNRPLRSDLLNSFQVVGFVDAGTAWNGISPFSDDNRLNTQIVQQGGLTITLDQQKNPLVMGYGFGLRARVLGYYLRADWAWGVEDGLVLPRVFYLSSTLDF